MVRILLIEDDREIRGNLARFLALEGHEVLSADNGVDGLALAPLADLVLCDLMLPGIDGFAVLESLRAAPATARLPFLIATASADTETTGEAIRRGADGYLVKPFDLRALGLRVREILEQAAQPPP